MDKVVFVVQIIWDRSYLWNSCKTEARAYASPGEVSPWLCWAAPAPSKRVWSETILATPVEIPRACFVLRWLQVSFLYATGCLGPIHWKCQFFHHCIYDVWGYFVSSYSCHFYKSCGLCGALWIFGLVLFLVFWELCFRKSRCVWHGKVRFASYFSTLVGGQKYRGFLVASLRSRVDWVSFEKPAGSLSFTFVNQTPASVLDLVIPNTRGNSSVAGSPHLCVVAQ